MSKLQFWKDFFKLMKRGIKRGYSYTTYELLLIYKGRWFWKGLFLIGLEILVIIFAYLLFK